MNTIGKRLAFARKLSGLNARKLGLRSGLSSAIVGMIESEDRLSPEGKTVAKLAATLGVTTDWLLTGIGPAPTDETIRKYDGDEEDDAEQTPTGTGGH